MSAAKFASHPQTTVHPVVDVRFAGAGWTVEVEYDDEGTKAFSIMHAVKLEGRWFWPESVLSQSFIDGIEKALDEMSNDREPA